MPLYDSATVATALHVTSKWLDNLLSHNKIDGVSGGRQGVARRLSLRAVESIALVRDLSAELGIPAAVAIQLAERLLHDSGPTIPASSAATLTLDAGSLREQVASSLAKAVEVAPRPRRGRPPGPRS